MKKCLFVLSLIGTVLFASTAFAESVDLVNLEPLIGHPFELVVTPDEAYRGYHHSSEEYHFLTAAGTTLEIVIRPKEYGITITRVNVIGHDANGNQPANFAYVDIPYSGRSAKIFLTPSQRGFAPYKMIIAFKANDVTGSFIAWLHTSAATLPNDDDLVSPGGCNAGFGVGALFLVLALGALRKKEA